MFTRSTRVFTQQRLSQPRQQSVFSRTVSHISDIRILLFRTMQPLLLPKCSNSTARREALFTLLVHLATNGAAERLIRTFKEALRKSSKPPKQPLQEFLLMYRRMPTHCGYSPSELLNGRQIRTKIDTLIPVPLQLPLPKKSLKKIFSFKVGDPVYAPYYGPRRNRDPRWVSGVIVQARGTPLFHVRIVPNGPIWKRNID